MPGNAPAYRFQHIRELDGLRGLAVLMVFFHHAISTSISPQNWPPFIQHLHAISRYGANGVDIFFVLSGFLITSLLFGDRDKPAYLHNFYWKRILRIGPLFVLTLLLVALINPAARSYVVLSLLFVVNYANLFHVSAFEGPFWTLAIEEQFYLVWPQLTRRFAVERLQAIAIAICCITPVLRLLSVLSPHHNFFQTQFRADGLALGAVLACQVFLHKLQVTPAVGNPRLRGPKPPPAATPQALWFRKTFLRITLPAALLLAVSVSGWPIAFLRNDVANGLVISASILLTYSVIGYAVCYPRSIALACLRSEILCFFGLISYCFYLGHLYILRIYDHWVGDLAAGDVTALFMRSLAALVLTTCACLLARYLVELPAQRLRPFVLRDGSRRSPASASASSTGTAPAIGQPAAFLK